MRFVPLLAALAVLLPAAARAQSIFETRDTLLVDAAAVPGAGHARGSVGAGTASSIDGSGEINSGSVAVLYAPVRTVAIQLGSQVETNSQQSPSATMRWQILDQDRFGANLAAQVRYKSVGFTSDGAEVEGSVNAGRRFDSFDIAANAVLGRETSTNGMDAEGRLSSGYFFGDHVRVGADLRYRQEVAEDDEADAGAAPKDEGRKFDLLAGPTIAWQISTFSIQALAGYYAPKGANGAGAAGLLLASLDF